MKIGLEELRKLQHAGNVISTGPISFDELELPIDLRLAWERFLIHKYLLNELLKKYDIERIT